MNWRKFFKKKYKVLKAYPVDVVDVTHNYENRNISGAKTILLGKKKLQYMQNLTIERNNVIEHVRVFVKHKIKINKAKKIELILLPKAAGDSIWI